MCPINICKMRLIRVDYGTTKEELFDFDSNGTFKKTDSCGGCVLQAFADYYNIEITNEDYFSNYNWYNTIQAVDNGFVDIIFGPTLPTHNLVSHLDKGAAYTYEEFIFIDTIPKAIPTLFVLITPLKIEVWICFTGVVILFSVFIKLLNNFQTNRKASQRLDCLDHLALYFNQPVSLPKKSGIRIVINLWLVYALLMNAFYNCNFVSALIKMRPKFYWKLLRN
ncbi:uncharacterized protein LOC116416823 [Nasonia vitripennis]|uniref:Uncharacterized protein n=1 Tax=Nasonia vitripennis TaxID=7425 RepID=A0A7M7T8N5_NASVI|nr:uncharacterized protein LOC116416823 [Nasonia vitripennis]